jgi:hypothetical protein
MTPAIAAKSPRRKCVQESFASASACIGPVESGLSLFAVTRGQFSMIDVINHLIAEVGPCHVSVWTWAIADYEVQAFTALLKRRDILGANLIVDTSAEKRNSDLIQQWRDRFGSETVKVCKNHSKIARIWSSDYRLLARGSMNLNFNPRFEQLDITEGGADFDLVKEIEDELPVLRRNASNSEIDKASKLSLAYEASTLDMFKGTKIWAK